MVAIFVKIVFFTCLSQLTYGKVPLRWDIFGLQGSCLGRCWDSADQDYPCQCNYPCTQHGDCCPDYQHLCIEGTCQGRCGDSADSSYPCQCNALCEEFGDCCHDYLALCTQSSCSGRCGQSADDDYPCQCNWLCETFGDCCDDYIDLCTEGSCQGRCGDSADDTFQCQCNPLCETFGDCCEDYKDLCTCDSGSPTDNELRKLASELYDMDENRLNDNDYNINPNGQKLFTYVNENYFNKPTYKAFIELLDNYIPETNTKEPQCPPCEEEVDAFLAEVLSTKVMQKVWKFLSCKGLASSSETRFLEELKQWWFRTYSRTGNILGSSGFEHVFLGEIQGGVIGFHNWIHFYLEEKDGRLQYTKNRGDCEPRTQKVSMTWHDKDKITSSMYIGTSPEFELAIYSLCFAARTNGYCPLTLGGQSSRILSYTMPGVSPKTVGTAHPSC